VSSASNQLFAFAQMERWRLAQRRRASRDLQAQPGPASVSTGRATVIDVRGPLGEVRQAHSWLEQAGEAELARAVEKSICRPVSSRSWTCWAISTPPAFSHCATIPRAGNVPSMARMWSVRDAVERRCQVCVAPTAASGFCP
jgi:hypothetical protein